MASSNFLQTLISIGVMGVLFVLSMLFNQSVDRVNDHGDNARYDGDTAIWVARGVLYTIIGWAVIVLIWLGWRVAVVASASLLACFVMSGLPMYFGEAERARRKRINK